MLGGTALTIRTVRLREDFCSVLGREGSDPNDFPAILGKFMAAATAPATSNTCKVVPRKSSSVKYLPQNRSIVAGAIQ
jgi:hypothetical protein